MEPQALLGVEGDCALLGLLVPSPQSEAVTHEMEELSLQPTLNLPPLNERKNVLQLRLQQRRTREQLVDQGIMPPLKSPAAFHGQIRSLERARTENFLKHKIRSRPERAELVRMHILQETGAEPSLQATQMRLKRARLADNLNEKIAQRPGPLELVEKNILPVEPSLKDAIIEGEVDYPTLAYDEDSGDGLSPDQPASQESQASAPSPGESRAPETPTLAPGPLTITNAILQPLPVITQVTADFLKALSANEPPISWPAVPAQPVATVTPSKPGPTLVKQSQPKQPSEKSRSKKGKEPKPRVKKLKYHQYVPPDQKQEASEAPMDSSYARLLQQQQLFLQLQILSQQQQHYNYQTILPAPLKPVAEGAASGANGLPASIVVSLPAAPPPPPPPPPPARPNASLSNRKPGVLPANLEEMKVAELKMELKLRGLPVSGTKTDLMEKLKPYQDPPSTPTQGPTPSPGPASLSSVPMELSAPSPAHLLSAPPRASDSMGSPPPVSPNASDPSRLQDLGVPEALRDPQAGSPRWAGAPSASPLGARPPEEKDRRLHEKERQIEELMRKLEQEQRLVEELKMQLEVEKKAPPGPASSNTNTVKMEGRLLSACSTSPAGSTLGGPAYSHLLGPSVVKLEDVTVSSLPSPQAAPSLQQAQMVTQPQAAPGLQQFFIRGQPQALLGTAGQPATQILLPVSLANSPGTIQLPSNTVSLQPVLQATVANQGPGLMQASMPQRQTTTMETASAQQLSNHNLLQTLTVRNGPASGLAENQRRPDMSPHCFLSSSPESRVSPRASPNHSLPNGSINKSPCPSQTFILQPSALLSQLPKTREPPRYEDAVKQSRNLHMTHAAQVPTATSQQMDDLFDILIQSGEITPFIQPEAPASLPKTAHLTTLPVGTALSRPPPQVQLAPPPALSPDPSLASLATDNQLEAFLERTLAGSSPVSDARTLGLMEELQAQLMEQQPYSPMDTSELSFCDSSSPPSSLAVSLSDPALDNMEWLDLTMPPGSTGGLTPLGIPADFLDTHNLQLHWE
ncbi:myocardin-related transcription factor B [Aplochiton taeniatus]